MKAKYFFPDTPQGSNLKTFCHWNHFCTGLILRLYTTCQSAADLEASRTSKALSWYLHYTTKSFPSDTRCVYMHDIRIESTAGFFPLFCLFRWGGGCCCCFSVFFWFVVAVVVYLFTTLISLERGFLQEALHRIPMSLLCSYQKGNYQHRIKLTSCRGQAFTLNFPVSLRLIFHVLWSQNLKKLFTIKSFKTSWWRARHWCSVLREKQGWIKYNSHDAHPHDA